MGFLGAKIERIREPIEFERESGKRINGQSSKTSVWLPHTDVFAFGAASFHGMRLSRFGSVGDPHFPAQHHERASECRLLSKVYVQCTGVQTSTIGEMV